jgi:hypothetical protein
MRPILLLLSLSLLTGCADIRLPWGERAQRADATVVPAEDEAALAEDVLVEPGDTVETAALERPAERAAAQAGAGQAGAFLGETLASLGAPGETGFWLVTGLVDAPVAGRVESGDGRSVGLELRPSGREPGAGSQISLSAMRALDLPPTALPTLRVFRASQ